MMTEVNQRPSSFKKFIHRIVSVTAAVLIVFSLANLSIVLMQMSRNVYRHAQHTLTVVETDDAAGISTPLSMYNLPDESRIWIMRDLHVVAKSPNAGALPPVHIKSGFVGALNAYQLVGGNKARTVIVDVPLTDDDIVVEELLAALIIGVAVGGVIVQSAARWFVQQALQSVGAMTLAAENMLNAGTVGPLPILTEGDDFYDLSVLLNRLVSDLRERQERERAQLADFAHHLRTPLMVVHGNLDVLRHDVIITPRSEEALVTIDTTVSEMKNLVSDLVSMEQALNLSPELFQPMGYWDMVHEVVEYAQAIASEFPHISVEVGDEWGDDVHVMVYPKFARRAFWAIVDNAVKYCDASRGYIGIFAVRDFPGFSGITVANNGPEISPADMPHIFKRFYRGAHSRDIPGSGLGLPLVRSLTQAQKGTIDVTSRNGLTRVTLRFRNMQP